MQYDSDRRNRGRRGFGLRLPASCSRLPALMTSAALVIIGSEMVDPGRQDANGPLAKERLLALGIPVTFLARVEDRGPAIHESLKAALGQCDLVITSGGLGPTGDDVTREGVADLLGVGVHEDARWMGILEERLTSRGRQLTALGRRQALTVDGGVALDNGAGLACGCWLSVGTKHIILLPGVPREFQDILDAQVLPKLSLLFPGQPEVRQVRAVAAGLPEVEAEETLRPWYGRTGIDVSILPALGVLRIGFALRRPPLEDLDATVEEVRSSLSTGLGRHLVSLDGTSLDDALGQALIRRGWSLATAESCTGGLLGQKVVAVPGASRYYLGGITAYDNGAKERLLGVPRGLLERHGAVSEEVARAMVRGARARFNAACALSTTGIAGPDGGTPEKPVGTVWLACGTPEGEWARRISFPLDRASVMEMAANTALFLLWSKLVGGPA